MYNEQQIKTFDIEEVGMRNLRLVVFQFVLSFFTLLTGVVISGLVVTDSFPALLIDLTYLLALLAPFFWWAGWIDNRKMVDDLFILEQVLWNVILFAAAYKYKHVLFSDGSDVFVAVVLVISFFGLRFVTQDSFLKQER